MSHPLTPIKVDPSRYLPKPEEIAFLRTQSKIKDEEELIRLILEVQKEAYEIFPYMSIRRFRFLSVSIDKHPHWYEVNLLREKREGAILLDIGCGFGNNLRMAISHGWPLQNVAGNDLYSQFWNFGHKLYQDSDTLPIAFVGGSIFHSAVLDLSASPSGGRPSFDEISLTTLTTLVGHVSVVYTNSFFHLFTLDLQIDLAKRIHALLSKKPGSMILGTNGGEVKAGQTLNPRGQVRYAHNPESFKKLWNDVFGADKIEVDCVYEEVEWKWDEEEAKIMQLEQGKSHGRLVWRVKVISE